MQNRTLLFSSINLSEDKANVTIGIFNSLIVINFRDINLLNALKKHVDEISTLERSDTMMPKGINPTVLI